MSFEAKLNGIIVKAYLINQQPKVIIDKQQFTCIACKEQLIFVQEYYKQKGTVRGHFKHYKDSDCVGYTPEGESIEHYTIKMNLLNDLTNNKPITIKVNDLQWTFDKSLVDYIKEEKFSINERRADIIVYLKKPNFILGNGFAIEVMVSEKQESINAKAIDYAQNFLSVAQTRDGIDIEVKTTYPVVLRDFFYNTFNKYKSEIEFYEERIKLLKNPFIEKAIKNNWNCLNCARATKTPVQYDRTGTTITCWKDYSKLTKHGQEKRTDFTPCDKYIPSDKPALEINETGVVSCSKTQKNF